MKSSSNRDELGTFFQRPNLPIIIWFVCFLISKLSSGKTEELFSLIAFGALFTWAWLEIFQGTNMFRRLVGSIVLFIIIYNRI